MWRARRSTQWRHGVAAVVALGLALSAAIGPVAGRVAAQDAPSDPTPTTAPEETTETTPTETTTVTTLPAPTATDTTVAEDTTTTTTVAETTTTTTVAETTTVTTIEQPTPEQPAAPTARSTTFAAASAVGGLSLTITDPFAVNPATLDFGAYAVGSGSQATQTVTFLNNTGRELHVETEGADGLSVVGIAGCGNFVPPANTVASLDLGVDQTCEIYVTIDTSAIGPVAGRLILTDVDSGSIASADVTGQVVPAAPPANDNWVNAQNLSALAIPAFVGVPGQFPGTQQPRDTEEVDGSTEFATYEPGEYDPGRPGGSLWYRYTSPPGGFAGRLGYRATPGFFVLVSTDNTSAAESRRAKGNTSSPSSIQFVRMEPGHTVWFSVFNESPFIDPGRFTLELFQAPDEQDPIVEAYGGTGVGEFALSTDFNLSSGGDTHHLTPDLPGGEPDGWSTLRFAVPGTLSVTHRSATARTLGPFEADEGSERPLGLRIYRSPSATRVDDPTVLTEVGVGTSSISNALDGRISGSRWETTATVAVTPGRYYWTYEEAADGPTFFISDVQFRASSVTDTERPTASITTPPDGARFAVGSVPSSLVSSCTDSQGPTSSFITVDGIQTTSLATSPGSHTVSLECTDTSGNMSSVTSTYTVFVPTGPCVIVDTRSVDFGEVAVGSTSSTRPVVVRSCSDAPIRVAVSISNATGVGGAKTWLASTSTVPADNQFTWSVTPPGSPSPIPVGPIQTPVGPALAAGASRTDEHRIALGPTGPGLGTRFTSTFTYTALTP